MTTKKTPTIKNQPTKPQQTAKHTNHQRAPTGSSSRNLANRSHTSAPSTAAKISQHAEKRQQGQASTATHSHQRRRRRTFGQRLTHLSAGSWFAMLTGALVIGIIVFAIIASRSSPTTTASNTPTGLLAAGTPAPTIATLPAADGKSYSLEQYKGKVVVLEFFAPWCPHCQDETATLKQLQQDYGSKGVQVLSVSASPYGRNYESGDQSPISLSDIQWFSSNFGLNYPALFDPSLKAGNAYGVQGFPTMYILNKQGVITYATSGEMSYASLQQQVDAALNQ